MKIAYIDGIKFAKKGIYWELLDSKIVESILLEEMGGIRRTFRRTENISLGAFHKIISDNLDLRSIARNRGNFIQTVKRNVIINNRNFTYIKGKAVRNSRTVVETHLKRKLKREEIIHHIDGDSLNDSIDNLYLCKSQSDHAKLHHSLEKLASRLLKHNIVDFCPDTGEYIYVHSFPEAGKALSEVL